jgi:hypothetical protein
MVDVVRIAEIAAMRVDVVIVARWREDRGVVISALIHGFRSAKPLADAAPEAIDGADQLGEQLLAIDLILSVL